MSLRTRFARSAAYK